jgi:mono/diheme cytochrome c family protein
MALAASMRRIRAVRVALFASVLLGTAGCSGSNEGPTPGDEPENPMIAPPDELPDPPAVGGTGSVGEGGIGGGFDPGFAGGFANRPIDERPVIHSQVAPRAIQGGTLAISPDDAIAVVADGDRDRIVMVDIVNGGVMATLPLVNGAEPGRVVFDAGNHAHIALRGTGEVVTLDVATREITETRSVCGVPSGLAYDAVNDAVMVACQGGELVTLPAAGGAATRTLHIEQDLRDVVIQGERVFVSIFKKAELLELDADGAILSREAPKTQTGVFFSPFSGVQSATRTLEPAVAWRTIPTPSGSVTMLHQRAQLDEIDIGLGHDGETSAEDGSSDVPNSSAGTVCQINTDGSEVCFDEGVTPGFPGSSGGGYGSGGGTCTSIVETGVTMFGGEGTVSSTPPIVGAIVPVDGAISPDGRYFAIAVAGSFEDQTFFFTNPNEGLGVVVIDTQEAPVVQQGFDENGQEVELENCIVAGNSSGGGMIGSGQSVAVAFDTAGTLVVQTRDPNRLRVYEAGCVSNCAPALDISLGGEARRDTGHDLFHANAGGGLACASCHPGGGDDGRTWHFKDLGPRRTQLFTMGIKGTEPLHWDGDLPTLSDLVGEVFVKRMGGAPQTQDRVGALDAWMNTLATLPSIRATDDEAAQRGKHLFESDAVACTSCHVGEKLTNNKTVDVGTGGAFQVPSLINVAYHSPFIHTGCAQTLRERFDPACGGGDMHGKTAHLTDVELDDLVAYLETL